MLKQAFRLTLLSCFGFLTLFTSCEKEEVTTSEETENFVFNTVEDMETRAACGRLGCYEFVFPITIELPDGTTPEVNDYDELRATIRAWYEDNAPDTLTRPQLSYPLEIVSESGQIISVENGIELAQLRRACRRANRPWRRPGKQHRACFRLLYPINIEFPNGTIEEASTRVQVGVLLRQWKADNPNSEERPMLAYPTTVVFSDGSTVVVNSAEELQALKDTCHEEASDE